MKKYILAFIILLSSVSIFASKADSLQKVIMQQLGTQGQEKQALENIEKLYDLSYKTNPHQLIEVVARAIYLNDSILNDTTASLEWKHRLGKIYLRLGKLDQAMAYISQIKNQYKKNGNKKKYAEALVDLGDIYMSLNVPELAKENYIKARKIFQEIGDENMLAQTNAKIAIIYNNDYMSEEAFATINKTLDSLPDLRPETKATLYSTLAKIYADNGQLDSATIAYKKALELLENTTGKDYEKGHILLELGELSIELQKYTSAKRYLHKAYIIFDNLGATDAKAQTLTAEGIAYMGQGKYSQAIAKFNRAKQYAEQTENLEVLQKIYLNLAKIYEKQNQIAKALKYYKQYEQYRDQYYQQLTQQGYAEVILMFQNEEKQREIQLLKKEEALKNQQLRSKQQMFYASLIVIVLLLGLVIVTIIMMRRVRKANALLQEQFEQIKLQKREIETQSRILEKATQSILKQKEKIELQNKNIRASINYASRIQKAMLPKPEEFAKYFDEFFIYYRPKEVVSGDFYWLAEVQDKPSLFQDSNHNKKIILAVSDCTGHGVPGAFMAMLGDAYLNQIVKVQKVISPDKILEILNKAIRDTLQTQEEDSTDGMDIAICVIDRQKHTLEFAGAKSDLLYVQNDKMIRVHGDMFSIGGLKQDRLRTYQKSTIDITADTLLYMYSDGFQDQFGGKHGRKYMSKKFREFLFSIHNEPLDKQKILIHQEFNNWKGKNYHQMDDITVIGVKLNGKFTKEGNRAK